MAKFDIYETVTTQIITMLEAGTAPWRSPIMGRGTAGHPKSMSTGKKYSGINIFLLAFTAYAKGYQSAHWITFHEAKERGGNVKKGEKSQMIVYFKKLDIEDKTTGDKKQVPLLRYYNVFNVEQTEGIEIPDKVVFTPSEFNPDEACEAIVRGYADGPKIIHEGASAYWRPSSDEVHIPEPTRFNATPEYYSTLLHELSHSTGHSTRLDRKLDTEPKPFGSADYGREELVAEMAAAFLCGHAGIQPRVIDNQAAYLAGWLKQLREDKKLVISAASTAQKAADWILGERGQPTP